MGVKPIHAACILLALCLILTSFVGATALDDYVVVPDPNFAYSQVGPSEYDGSPFLGYTGTRAYVLEMTSQAWRDASEVTPNIWTHWVTVIVPEAELLLGPVKDTALILINDGDIGDPAPIIDPADPDHTYAEFRQLAAGTRTVIIELQDVPNQPLQFADEAFGRVEDEIIAYSWDRFLDGGDDYWPVQLPMTKAIVRCMDAVQAFVNDTTGKTISHFVLVGGSKRGMAAYLAAAVDDRVVAIAPIVTDLLNMRRNFTHHWACYGFWADALWPYEELGIFDRMDTPRADELVALVDPYAYRDRLTMPKFIVTAAGDDFFVHDSVQFYLDDLPGETYVRTVPNTNHYLDGAYEAVIANMVPYYDAFLRGQSRPEFSWTLNDDGSMTVTTTDAPLAVNLWRADNPTDRDFRQVTIGTAWTLDPNSLTETAPGVYHADPGVPLTGWRSYFVELVFDFSGSLMGKLDGYDYHFTTEMRVLPEVRPFETDFTRDRATDIADIFVLAENWLAAAPYYDIIPRRTGDGIINLDEMSAFSLHWLESQ